MSRTAAHTLAALATVALLTRCAHHGASPMGPMHTSAVASPPSAALRDPSAFDAIEPRDARSAALFGEVSRVLLHPRCLNCHPSDDTPRQGDHGAFHDPPVVRGEQDRGVVAMQCSTCHQDRNPALARVPGAPGWHLAPHAMAWAGRSLAALCAQLKDPARNGGRTLAQIQGHMAHDELVGWGWHPGSGRVPAPGTQAQLGALVQAWIDTGARCPTEETSR